MSVGIQNFISHSLYLTGVRSRSMCGLLARWSTTDAINVFRNQWLADRWQLQYFKVAFTYARDQRSFDTFHNINYTGKILRFILAAVKVNVKFILEQVQEGPDREYRYSSTLTLTSLLGEWFRPRLGGVSPGKANRCPLYRRVGEPQGWSVRVRKSSTPSGFDSRTIQPVASCYRN